MLFHHRLSLGLRLQEALAVIVLRSVVSCTINASVNSSFRFEVKDVSQQIGIPGIVRNGVVVPQSNQPLPEGSHVEILLEPGEMPSGLRRETLPSSIPEISENRFAGLSE